MDLTFKVQKRFAKLTAMQVNQVGSIRRIINASRYSLAGLKACFKNEQAFRQEIYAAIILTPLALLSAVSNFEKALLLAALLQVLIVELLNSALEHLCDRVSTEHHILSGQAKDMGSAAVAISILLAVIVWLVILL